jgi:hypothetical protein
MPFKLLKQATVPNPVGTILKVENVREGATKSKWGWQGGRNYTTKLKVQTSSQYVGAIQVIQSVAPRYGAFYRWPLVEFGGDPLPLLPVEQDTGSFLQSIECDPDGDDGVQWIVTLEYTPFDVEHEVGEQDPDGNAIDPTTKRPDVSWGFASSDKSMPMDESDPPQPYINTANDPLEDPPQGEEGRPILTISRAEWTYDVDWTKQFVNHVNEDDFLGFEANTVKCRDIPAKLVYDADWGNYWEVTYEFEIRNDEDGNGWDELVVNEGYRKLDASGNKVVIMISEAPASSPQLLTKDGKDTIDDGGVPYLLRFKRFKRAKFANLKIPDDILTTPV